MVALALAALLAADAGPGAVGPARDTRARPAALILGFSGGAVAVSGLVLRFFAGAAYERIEVGYPAFRSYAELRQVRALGELEQQLAFGLLAGGAALVLVGALVGLVLGAGG